MSNAPAPTPAPLASRALVNVLVGTGIAVALASLLLIGVVTAHFIRGGLGPSPAPTSPIPADTRAYLLSEVSALRSVAASVRGGSLKSDPASLTSAISAARKGANDKLAADVQAGDVPANLSAVAEAMAALIRGAK